MGSSFQLSQDTVSLVSKTSINKKKYHPRKYISLTLSLSTTFVISEFKFRSSFTTIYYCNPVYYKIEKQRSKNSKVHWQYNTVRPKLCNSTASANLIRKNFLFAV